MGISINDLKKAEKRGKVSESIDRIPWKRNINNFLEKSDQLMTAAEIREGLKASNHLYSQLQYFVNTGFLKSKVIDNKTYYGLSKWFDGGYKYEQGSGD